MIDDIYGDAQYWSDELFYWDIFMHILLALYVTCVIMYLVVLAYQP